MKRDKFIITGGNKLYGEVTIQTSKNASLPIMSACLLVKDKVTLHNLPDILDVNNMILLLKKLGVKITKYKNKTFIDSTNATSNCADCKLSKTMRSSLFLLGSMLSRFKTAQITMPGGCKIGKRPIDLHISAFKKLNVKIEECGEFINFDATNAKANKIKLRIPSVGATENIIQFAVFLKGKTTILNPAKEPEVVDLSNFLNSMGAKIFGAGTNKITIYGVKKLNTTSYLPIADRIVAGTIMCAVAICGGDVTIKNAALKQNKKLLQILYKLGCKIEIKSDIIHLTQLEGLHKIGKVYTGYYPNFPTDLQSIILTLSCLIDGKTQVKENIFENRFLIASELAKMGANIKLINNKLALVTGVKKLAGCEVEAKDLRGGAALVLAGLAATGTTTILNVHYIDRGYEHLEAVLSNLGANIRRE